MLLSTDRSRHFKLDQLIKLDRIFHRQFPGKRLNEAHHDHFCGFLFTQSPRHEVEELFFADFGNNRLVLDLALEVLDNVDGQGVGGGQGVDQNRIALDLALRPESSGLGSLVHDS